MPVQDKSSHDILMEQLVQRVGALASEQKAKESAIKELNTQVKMAEAESVLKIREAHEAYQATKLELDAAIAPLVGLRQTCEILRADIAQLKQAKLDAASDVKAARSGEIKNANESVLAANTRLAVIETAIHRLKASVAGL